MKELKDFLKRVPAGLWLIVLISFVIICAIPALFSQISWFFDFSQTGQIGDTIGGTMGPFIAIIAALLTFIAFWAQYEANQELVDENRRNHFENRFYKMLDIHLDSVEKLKTLDPSKPGSVFQKWCDNILNLYNLLMMDADTNDTLSTMMEKYKGDPQKDELLAFIRGLKSSKSELQNVMFEIAYCLFYSGSFSNLHYGDEAKSIIVREFASLFILSSPNNKDYDLPQKNEILGRYYRHLYQIVKYVDEKDEKLFVEANWKESYISLLRSQMSDYEQALLFYNAMSSIGSAWNENNYISKYKLIKNIPHSFIFSSAGISPYVKYEDALKEAEAKGEKFFEWL